MVPKCPPAWSFLTNRARVMLCIARDPAIRLREIGELVGITERAAHRIVVELSDAGYITRERVGRRNTYAIRADLSEAFRGWGQGDRLPTTSSS